MAARFWVGGSGTWDNVSVLNWSATSGGAPLATAPTTADTVTFDANSGTGTCTTAAGAACNGVNFNTTTVGLTLGANLTSNASFTFTAGTLDLQTFTLAATAFVSTNSNARTIAFGTGAINVTASNAFVWNTDTSTNLTVTGTPVVNATYSGSTGTRSLSLGGTTGGSEANSISVNVSAGSDTVAIYGTGMRDVNFTGFSGTWSTANSKTFYGSLTISTGMAVAASLGTLNFAATSGTKTITTNNKTIDGIIIFNGVGGTFQFADALTQGSSRAFTITRGTVKLFAGSTNTVGSFATGSGTTQRFLQSTVAGTQATITDPSGVNAATYLTIQDIAATGGATWNAFSANNNVDAGNNTGWNFGYTPQYAYEYPTGLRSFTERNQF